MTTIRVVTDIDAPAGTVWTELVSVEQYAEWNPFITAFRGRLMVGGMVEIRIAPPGGRPMTFRPTITELDEGTRLEWLGRLFVPGVFDGRHSFRLEPLPDDRTRLTQAEDFSGLLVPLMGTVLRRTYAGFEAMNDALRVRAEGAATPRRPLNRS